MAPAGASSSPPPGGGREKAPPASSLSRSEQLVFDVKAAAAWTLLHEEFISHLRRFSDDLRALHTKGLAIASEVSSVSSPQKGDSALVARPEGLSAALSRSLSSFLSLCLAEANQADRLATRLKAEVTTPVEAVLEKTQDEKSEKENEPAQREASPAQRNAGDGKTPALADGGAASAEVQKAAKKLQLAHEELKKSEESLKELVSLFGSSVAPRLLQKAEERVDRAKRLHATAEADYRNVVRTHAPPGAQGREEKPDALLVPRKRQDPCSWLTSLVHARPADALGGFVVAAASGDKQALVFSSSLGTAAVVALRASATCFLDCTRDCLLGRLPFVKQADEASREIAVLAKLKRQPSEISQPLLSVEVENRMRRDVGLAPLEDGTESNGEIEADEAGRLTLKNLLKERETELESEKEQRRALQRERDALQETSHALRIREASRANEAEHLKKEVERLRSLLDLETGRRVEGDRWREREEEKRRKVDPQACLEAREVASRQGGGGGEPWRKAIDEELGCGEEEARTPASVAQSRHPRLPEDSTSPQRFSSETGHERGETCAGATSRPVSGISSLTSLNQDPSPLPRAEIEQSGSRKHAQSTEDTRGVEALESQLGWLRSQLLYETYLLSLRRLPSPLLLYHCSSGALLARALDSGQFARGFSAGRLQSETAVSPLSPPGPRPRAVELPALPARDGPTGARPRFSPGSWARSVSFSSFSTRPASTSSTFAPELADARLSLAWEHRSFPNFLALLVEGLAASALPPALYECCRLSALSVLEADGRRGRVLGGRDGRAEPAQRVSIFQVQQARETHQRRAGRVKSRTAFAEEDLQMLAYELLLLCAHQHSQYAAFASLVAETDGESEGDGERRGKDRSPRAGTASSTGKRGASAEAKPAEKSPGEGRTLLARRRTGQGAGERAPLSCEDSRRTTAGDGASSQRRLSARSTRRSVFLLPFSRGTSEVQSRQASPAGETSPGREGRGEARGARRGSDADQREEVSGSQQQASQLRCGRQLENAKTAGAVATSRRHLSPEGLAPFGISVEAWLRQTGVSPGACEGVVGLRSGASARDRKRLEGGEEGRAGATARETRNARSRPLLQGRQKEALTTWLAPDPPLLLANVKLLRQLLVLARVAFQIPSSGSNKLLRLLVPAADCLWAPGNRTSLHPCDLRFRVARLSEAWQLASAPASAASTVSPQEVERRTLRSRDEETSLTFVHPRKKKRDQLLRFGAKLPFAQRHGGPGGEEAPAPADSRRVTFLSPGAPETNGDSRSVASHSSWPSAPEGSGRGSGDGASLGGRHLSREKEEKTGKKEDKTGKKDEKKGKKDEKKGKKDEKKEEPRTGMKTALKRFNAQATKSVLGGVGGPPGHLLRGPHSEKPGRGPAETHRAQAQVRPCPHDLPPVEGGFTLFGERSRGERAEASEGEKGVKTGDAGSQPGGHESKSGQGERASGQGAGRGDRFAEFPSAFSPSSFAFDPVYKAFVKRQLQLLYVATLLRFTRFFRFFFGPALEATRHCGEPPLSPDLFRHSPSPSLSASSPPSGGQEGARWGGPAAQRARPLHPAASAAFFSSIAHSLRQRTRQARCGAREPAPHGPDGPGEAADEAFFGDDVFSSYRPPPLFTSLYTRAEGSDERSALLFFILCLLCQDTPPEAPFWTYGEDGEDGGRGRHSGGASEPPARLRVPLEDLSDALASAASLALLPLRQLSTFYHIFLYLLELDRLLSPPASRGAPPCGAWGDHSVEVEVLEIDVQVLSERGREEMKREARERERRGGDSLQEEDTVWEMRCTRRSRNGPEMLQRLLFMMTACADLDSAIRIALARRWEARQGPEAQRDGRGGDACGNSLHADSEKKLFLDLPPRRPGGGETSDGTSVGFCSDSECSAVLASDVERDGAGSQSAAKFRQRTPSRFFRRSRSARGLSLGGTSAPSAESECEGGAVPAGSKEAEELRREDGRPPLPHSSSARFARSRQKSTGSRRLRRGEEARGDPPDSRAVSDLLSLPREPLLAAFWALDVPLLLSLLLLLSKCCLDRRNASGLHVDAPVLAQGLVLVSQAAQLGVDPTAISDREETWRQGRGDSAGLSAARDSGAEAGGEGKGVDVDPPTLFSLREAGRAGGGLLPLSLQSAALLLAACAWQNAAPSLPEVDWFYRDSGEWRRAEAEGEVEGSEQTDGATRRSASPGPLPALHASPRSPATSPLRGAPTQGDLRPGSIGPSGAAPSSDGVGGEAADGAPTSPAGASLQKKAESLGLGRVGSLGLPEIRQAELLGELRVARRGPGSADGSRDGAPLVLQDAVDEAFAPIGHEVVEAVSEILCAFPNFLKKPFVETEVEPPALVLAGSRSRPGTPAGSPQPLALEPDGPEGDADGAGRGPDAGEAPRGPAGGGGLAASKVGEKTGDSEGKLLRRGFSRKSFFGSAPSSLPGLRVVPAEGGTGGAGAEKIRLESPRTQPLGGTEGDPQKAARSRSVLLLARNRRKSGAPSGDGAQGAGAGAHSRPDAGELRAGGRKALETVATDEPGDDWALHKKRALRLVEETPLSWFAVVYEKRGQSQSQFVTQLAAGTGDGMHADPLVLSKEGSDGQKGCPGDEQSGVTAGRTCFYYEAAERRNFVQVLKAAGWFGGDWWTVDETQLGARRRGDPWGQVLRRSSSSRRFFFLSPALPSRVELQQEEAAASQLLTLFFLLLLHGQLQDYRRFFEPALLARVLHLWRSLILLLLQQVEQFALASQASPRAALPVSCFSPHAAGAASCAAFMVPPAALAPAAAGPTLCRSASGKALGKSSGVGGLSFQETSLDVQPCLLDWRRLDAEQLAQWQAGVETRFAVMLRISRERGKSFIALRGERTGKEEDSPPGRSTLRESSRRRDREGRDRDHGDEGRDPTPRGDGEAEETQAPSPPARGRGPSARHFAFFSPPAGLRSRFPFFAPGGGGAGDAQTAAPDELPGDLLRQDEHSLRLSLVLRGPSILEDTLRCFVYQSLARSASREFRGAFAALEAYRANQRGARGYSERAKEWKRTTDAAVPADLLRLCEQEQDALLDHVVASLRAFLSHLRAELLLYAPAFDAQLPLRNEFAFILLSAARLLIAALLAEVLRTAVWAGTGGEVELLPAKGGAELLEVTLSRVTALAPLAVPPLLPPLAPAFLSSISVRLNSFSSTLLSFLEKDTFVPVNPPESGYSEKAADCWHVIFNLAAAVLENPAPIDWVLPHFLKFLRSFFVSFSSFCALSPAEAEETPSSALLLPLLAVEQRQLKNLLTLLEPEGRKALKVDASLQSAAMLALASMGEGGGDKKKKSPLTWASFVKMGQRMWGEDEQKRLRREKGAHLAGPSGDLLEPSQRAIQSDAGESANESGAPCDEGRGRKARKKSFFQVFEGSWKPARTCTESDVDAETLPRLERPRSLPPAPSQGDGRGKETARGRRPSAFKVKPEREGQARRLGPDLALLLQGVEEAERMQRRHCDALAEAEAGGAEAGRGARDKEEKEEREGRDQKEERAKTKRRHSGARDAPEQGASQGKGVLRWLVKLQNVDMFAQQLAKLKEKVRAELERRARERNPKDVEIVDALAGLGERAKSDKGEEARREGRQAENLGAFDREQEAQMLELEDVLSQRMDELRGLLHNTALKVCETAAAYIVYYELQRDIFDRLYGEDDFASYTLERIVAALPNTVELFFAAAPRDYQDDAAAAFMRCLIQAWCLLVTELGYSGHVFSEEEIDILEADLDAVRHYMKENEISPIFEIASPSGEKVSLDMLEKVGDFFVMLARDGACLARVEQKEGERRRAAERDGAGARERSRSFFRGRSSRRGSLSPTAQEGRRSRGGSPGLFSFSGRAEGEKREVRGDLEAGGEGGVFFRAGRTSEAGEDGKAEEKKKGGAMGSVGKWMKKNLMGSANAASRPEAERTRDISQSRAAPSDSGDE
ncbi:conserved hypothetical protein [Neospora caninum Liverpool]|uniref:Ig-like domain-containing protein n=1 Tax=Neospora caninum (strain Liverpool) TaxID=572307 RepID=F0VE42_NEOCL|nr:conserved hypothetical protein [Neospora caninum Liverpool]CBZ51985.1 conserved hypothetical protein [Neospora caninum Liverpool]|eukprot:XP_003882018.1 conserved hypothetical protein [Neospora caninum Liverpool]